MSAWTRPFGPTTTSEFSRRTFPFISPSIYRSDVPESSPRKRRPGPTREVSTADGALTAVGRAAETNAGVFTNVDFGASTLTSLLFDLLGLEVGFASDDLFHNIRFSLTHDPGPEPGGGSPDCGCQTIVQESRQVNAEVLVVLHQLVPCRFRPIRARWPLPCPGRHGPRPVLGGTGQAANLSNGSLLLVLCRVLYLHEDLVQIGTLE